MLKSLKCRSSRGAELPVFIDRRAARQGGGQSMLDI
jgi:hypothetical protein